MVGSLLLALLLLTRAALWSLLLLLFLLLLLLAEDQIHGELLGVGALEMREPHACRSMNEAKRSVAHVLAVCRGEK